MKAEPIKPVPNIKFTKAELARQVTHMNKDGSAVMRVDWRALCRDKYAPWGRGALSGLKKGR